ncbi:hypothetical protein WME90_03545 [Sorangium sp. So ce375]|uniref:hypothetical protein n=1 Tax=Sorangium sp. So ce375 TaxID=3133306 RepID=UPI003F5B5BBE
MTLSAARAAVLVGGKALGRAQLEGEVFVGPGEHRVEVRLEGYAPMSQTAKSTKTVKSAKGETADVGLAMVPVKSEAQAMGAKMEGETGGSGGLGGAGRTGAAARTLRALVGREARVATAVPAAEVSAGRCWRSRTEARR